MRGFREKTSKFLPYPQTKKSQLSRRITGEVDEEMLKTV